MADVKNIDLAFSSKYSTPTANDEIKLYDGKLEIEHNKTKISPDGIIKLVWFRDPHIKISFTDSNSNFIQDIFAKVAFLHLPNSIKPIKFSLLSFKLITDRKDNGWECSGRLIEPICLGNGQNLSYVILHLANFQDTLGKSTGTLHKRWSGRFCLNANGWNVTVDNVEDHELLYKSLKAFGGYGITHLIKIEK